MEETYAQQISGYIALTMTEFAPPPFSLVVVALPNDHQRVAILEGQLVVVLSIVVEDRVHLAVVHNA